MFLVDSSGLQTPRINVRACAIRGRQTQRLLRLLIFITIFNTTTTITIISTTTIITIIINIINTTTIIITTTITIVIITFTIIIIIIVTGQCNHAVALLVIGQAHDWIEYAVPGQSPHFLRRFTRHPHAQNAVDAGRALQLDNHNIAGGKRPREEVVALLPPISDHEGILEKPRLLGTALGISPERV